MKLYRIIQAFILSTLLLPGALFADVVLLNGGQILEGKIIGESKHIVVLELSNGEVLTVQKKEILEIEKEGSSGTLIPRLPPPRIEKWKAAALSAIPGYSGLYETEYARGGVFFTVTSFYTFYKALSMEFTASEVNYYKSSYFTDRFFGTNLGKFYATGVYGRTQFTDYSVARGLSESDAYVRWVMLHQVLYDRGHVEYEVGGTKYSREEYERARIRAWGYYLTVLLANAGLSYYFAVPPGQKGDASSSHNNGTTDSYGETLNVYAAPNFKGGLDVGLSYRF